MGDQSSAWSRAAANYEKEYIDPYRPEVRNPLLAILKKYAGQGDKIAADLGCGIGPLLPILSEQFQTVYAVDFAPGMLARARERVTDRANVEFIQSRLDTLTPLHGKVDVAVAINSLVMADLGILESTLAEIRKVLKPNGRLLGIVPAMDAVHYVTMLLLDRARAVGMPPEVARRNAAHHGDHEHYDFAFSQFSYQGLEQHFWQPFEVRYRLKRAGFNRIRQSKVLLDWKQFSCASDLKAMPPPWDWFFEAQ